MLDFLEKMREKPEPVRARFVFVVSATITGIVFLIWIMTIGVRLTDVTGSDSKARRSAESVFEDADQTVRSALEHSRAEYEAFQRELQNAAGAAATTSPAATTTGENADFLLQ